MRTFAFLTVMAVTLAISGCTATIRNHGYIPPEEDLQELVVGIDTRASVEDVVGSPTAGGILEGGNYFYVRSTVRTFGPRRPEVVDRQVLAISFDENGVLSNIESFGLEDGRVVTLSRRVTDSNIKGISLLRQLLGNLGNINAGQFLGGGN